MHSPALSGSTEEENGTNANSADTVNTNSDRAFSQDDVNCLIENLQDQADNISYEIEKIVGVHRDESGKSLYQVRWVAYTWIPEDCLGSFQHLIKEYLEKQNCTSKTSDDTDINENDENAVNSAVGENKDDSCPDDEESSEKVTEVDIDHFSEDGVDKYGDEEIVKDVKTEKFSADSHETYPLPTAFMVTIDETADSNVDNSAKQNAMYCPKCQQRFFLKSNLEVHVLFCKGSGAILPSSPAAANIEVTVGTEEVDSSMNTVSRLNVFSEDETFEYVPLDCDSTDCTTCTQRLPEGAIVGDSLTDLAQLVSHSRKRSTDDEIEIYECDECDREFLFKYPVKKTWIGELDKESPSKKRKIKNEKPFSCSICNRGFEDERDKVDHEEKHANTQSRYSCATCGEKFITRNMLQDHYDSRNECQPTKCDVCGRIFVHSSHLKRHLSIHAGIKPFVCSFCGHEFNQRSDLLRHEKKHTLNGKYICLKCSQDFSDVHVLKEHILTHKTDENTKQAFACERCDKVFGRKSHYKRHITIHDGIKPYSCEKCGKRFNQRTDLKRHLLSHFRREMKVMSSSSTVKKSENNLICVICNKVFANHAAFLEHDLVHQKIMSTGVLY